MTRAAVVAMLACACHAHLGDGSHDPLGDVDAPTAGDDAAIDGGVDAASACFNGRRVYLNFEGVTLYQGPSDATTDHAVWLGVAQANVPRFHSASGTRAQDIQTVVDKINAKLSVFPIDVVQQRPVSGPYVEVVFGGTPQTVNVPYLYAANRLDCDDSVKSDVVWVGDNTPTLQKVADFAVGGIAFGLGMTGTHDANDCMCGWLNQCQQPNNSACTLSMSITSDARCSNQTQPQDEVAAFTKAFCQ